MKLSDFLALFEGMSDDAEVNAYGTLFGDVTIEVDGREVWGGPGNPDYQPHE